MSESGKTPFVALIDPMVSGLHAVKWEQLGPTLEIRLFRNARELRERCAESPISVLQFAIVSLRLGAMSEIEVLGSEFPDVPVLVTRPELQSFSLLREAMDHDNVIGQADAAKFAELGRLLGRGEADDSFGAIGPDLPVGPRLHRLWVGTEGEWPLSEGDKHPSLDGRRLILGSCAMAYSTGEIAELIRARKAGTSTERANARTRELLSQVGQLLWRHAAEQGYESALPNRFVTGFLGSGEAGYRGGERAVQAWIRATGTRHHIVDLILRSGRGLPSQLIDDAGEEHRINGGHRGPIPGDVEDRSDR